MTVGGGPGLNASWDDAHYCVSLTVPANAVPGSYPILRNGVAAGLSVNVLGVPPTPIPKLTQVSTYAEIAPALATGADVELLPGVYDWPASIAIPNAGQRVYGVHRDLVVIRRLPYTAPDPFGTNAFGCAFISTQPGISISDFTYDCSESVGATVFHSFSPNDGLEIANLRVIQGGVAVNPAPEMIVRNIELEEGYVRPGQGTWYDNIRLRGADEWTAANNECIVAGNALCSNFDFDGTCRGFVYRGVSECYISTVTFRGICLAMNAGELNLFESGNPQTNSVLTQLFAHGCNGSLFQLSGQTSGIHAMHFEADGGGGIWLCPSTTGCSFSQGELRRTRGIDVGSQAGNTLDNIALIACNNTRSNQDLMQNAAYGINRCIRNIPAGMAIPATVLALDLAPGWTMV